MSKDKGIYEKVAGSGIWYIRYTVNGKIRRERAGTRSTAETLLTKRKAAALTAKLLPELSPQKKVTFAELVKDAIQHSRATNSPTVTYDFELRSESYNQAFGKRDAATIKKQELLAWLTNEAEVRGWKPSTRNRWQAGLSLIFRVGIDNEKIEKNPAAGIKRKTENNGRVRFLSKDEETALRRVIADRFPKFLPHLDLSLNTGMRMSEQYTMRWSQVDFDRKLITLPKTKNGTTRHIPLNAAAVGALAALKGTGDAVGLVFPSERSGESLQGSRGWFKNALKDAGVKGYTWHCNRHTFASRLVMAGVDIRTVGGLLGHKSLTMTMRYTHLAPEHNAAAVERLLAFSTN